MEPTASVTSSTVNLVKTIVGAGLFAIPFAFKNDGILVGILLIMLAAVTSGFGLFILAKCSKTLINPRNASFFSICMLTYPSLSPLFDLAMIVQCFGVGLSYLVLMGDIFPSLFGGNRDYWIVASAFIVVPLCCLKKLDNLKYSSILGNIALIYLALFIFGVFVKDILIEGNTFARGEISWIRIYDGKGLLSTFSIIIFAYVGAMNLFSICRELENDSMENILKVINGSIGISSIFFLLVGISGYLTFGSNVQGNIILNYDPNSIWIYLGKFCLAFMLLLSFPLLFHPLRIAVNNLVVWFGMTFGADDTCAVPSTTQETDEDDTTPTPIQLSISEEEMEANPEIELDIEEGLSQTVTTAEDTTDVQAEVSSDHDEEDINFPDSRFYLITGILLTSMYLLALNVKSFALVLALVAVSYTHLDVYKRQGQEW